MTSIHRPGESDPAKLKQLGEADIAYHREAIERYVEAWLSGDVQRTLACYHDDFTIHYLGNHALTGTHRGKAACLKVLAEFSKRIGRRKLVRVVSTMAGPGRAGMVVREALGPDAIETERVFIYTVRDGLLCECWAYDSDPALIDRLVGK